MIKNYTVIILAAGNSLRLKKDIKTKSKVLIKIKDNKDSFDYNLSMLKKIETSRIIINTHKYHSAFEKK